MKKRILRTISVLVSLIMFLSVLNIPALSVRADGLDGEPWIGAGENTEYVVPNSAAMDDFISNWYKVALGRDPYPNELKQWKKELTGGVTCGSRAAYGFIFSAEYQNKKKSNSAFVTDLYKLMLGRTPDASGKADWVNQLKKGKSREQIFAGFANSAEYYKICSKLKITAGYWEAGYNPNQLNNVNMFVERLYKVCFGRIGDKDGQVDWVNKLIKGQITGSKCAHDFVFSDEYVKKKLSDGDYVKNLYTAIMGRDYDEAGYNDWVSKINRGMSRDEVFAGFANSTEFEKICKKYGIKRGEYKATEIGTYDPNKHYHEYVLKNTSSKYLKSKASCTEAAVYYYSCSCGEYTKNKTFKSGKALGHSWDKGTVIKEATLTEEGSMQHKCTRKGCNETKTEVIPSILSHSKKGDIITFGKYEQDGDLSNGKEDIEWEILEMNENSILVISKYVLDSKPYHERIESVTWERSTLRSWLNEEFVNEAFNSEEKALIPTVELTNKDHPTNGAQGGNDTYDKVFCLSADEVEDIYGYKAYYDRYKIGCNQALIAAPTKYANEKGVSKFTFTEETYNSSWTDDVTEKYKDLYTEDVIGSSCSFWWLRSPAMNDFGKAFVSPGGVAGWLGNSANSDFVGVRPALYIQY